jgi:hypothetical protein
LLEMLNIINHYYVQIGEVKFICGTHLHSMTLELKTRVHTIKF